jgi:hypothetical protein
VTWHTRLDNRFTDVTTVHTYQVPWAVTLLNNSLRYPLLLNPKPVHTGLVIDKVFGSQVFVALLIISATYQLTAYDVHW